MCTGFIFKGKDIICAYNLDISDKDFCYELVKNDNLFVITIKIGSRVYYTHGVNSNSCFAVLPFMNDDNNYINNKCKRIDLLVDDFLKNKIDINTIKSLNSVSNIKKGSLHALFSSKDGCLMVEPGLGSKIIDRYQVITNYPLMKEVKIDNIFYGKDRYKFVNDNLIKLKDLSIEDALYLLKYSAQEGEYSTKVSFVYSFNEKKVYYCQNRDFDNILTHCFK